MIDLTTRYLGLPLRNPLVCSASPLCQDLEALRRMEEAGAAAVVLHSLFEEQLTVESLDLSHYLDQESAQRQDRRTAQAIVDRDYSAIDDLDACGAVVVRGLLAWARRHRHVVRLLDLRTSADTAGDAARVVGYGAFALSAPAGA